MRVQQTHVHKALMGQLIDQPTIQPNNQHTNKNTDKYISGKTTVLYFAAYWPALWGVCYMQYSSYIKSITSVLQEKGSHLPVV